MGGLIAAKKLGPKAPDTSGQERAAKEATALQRQIYEESVERSQPFYDVGVSGARTLADYLGVGGGDVGADPSGRPEYYGSLLQSFSPDVLTEDPGFAFRQAEGEKALERRLAAEGKSFSPEAVKALQQYNQDLASQEYGRAFDRYRAGQTDIYNRLGGLLGMGQQQIQNLQQAGQSYAGNVGQTLTSLADVQAAAQQQKAAGRSSMFRTLGGLAGMGIGASVGGPAGAGIGGQIGSSLGGLF